MNEPKTDSTPPRTQTSAERTGTACTSAETAPSLTTTLRQMGTRMIMLVSIALLATAACITIGLSLDSNTDKAVLQVLDDGGEQDPDKRSDPAVLQRAASLLALAGGLVAGLAALLSRHRFSLRSLVLCVLVLATMASLPWVLGPGECCSLVFDASPLTHEPQPLKITELTDGRDLLSGFPKQIWQRIGVDFSDVRGVTVMNNPAVRQYWLEFWISPRLKWPVRELVIAEVKERVRCLLTGRPYCFDSRSWSRVSKAANWDPEIERWCLLHLEIFETRSYLSRKTSDRGSTPANSEAAIVPVLAIDKYEARLRELEMKERELLERIGRRQP